MRPTPEQLASLTRLERASFRLADLLASPRLTRTSVAARKAQQKLERASDSTTHDRG